MTSLPAEITALIDKYAHGPDALRQALADFPADKLTEPLPPGEWSALQVVAHLTDFELVNADRIQAIIAEDGPQIPGRDENRFISRLHYDNRDIAEELDLISAVRRHITRELRSLSADDFQRVGIHSFDGPLTLAAVLGRVSGHLPHHADFLARKRELLRKSH